MLQTFVRLYLKAVKKQFLCPSSLLLIKQCVRGVCIVVLAVGVFYSNFSMGQTPTAAQKAGGPKITVSEDRSAPGKDAVDHFNLGVDYQKRGNAVKAIEEYKNVLKSDPDNAEAHNNLGAIYKEQGNLEKALEHYKFVVKSNPGMDEVHNNLGVIYYLRGDQEEAVEEYRKALELNPDNLMCLVNLGLVYKAQGMELKTIETLETILSIEPFQAEAHYNLAILYEELGHLEAAILHYSRFVDNAGKGYPDLADRVTGHIEDLKVSSFEVVRKKEIGVFPGGNEAY